jgi:nicotinamidase-related amidase
MAITTLDRHTALLVIDLQQGLISTPKAPRPIEEVIAGAAELVTAFRAADLPVVLAINEGKPGPRSDYSRPAHDLPDDFDQLLPELDERDGDIIVRRSAWSAFADTGLDTILESHNITGVVIVGIATSFGVESTARAAADLDYNVTIATDAITDLSADAHQNSVSWVFPALAETGTVADVLARLSER